MSLTQLFTQHNLSIFSALTEKEGSIRELAERTGSSPAKVHQAVELFKKKGLINEAREKNRRVIRLNRSHSLTQQLKALLNLDRILSATGFEALKKVGRLHLYGSYAQGTDDAESDIDLLIITDKKELNIRPTIRKLESEVGKKVSSLVMTNTEFKKLEITDPAFMNRLRNAIPLNEEHNEHR